MVVLRIEHQVFDFGEWKKVFDSDPVNRERSGVRRYSIMRPVDDEKYVMIELVFDTVREAEAVLAALRAVWGRMEGTIMQKAQTRIAEVVESHEY